MTSTRLSVYASNNKKNGTRNCTFHSFPNSSLPPIPEDKCYELIEVVLYYFLLERHTANVHTKAS
jgi:hypothetical protein